MFAVSAAVAPSLGLPLLPLPPSFSLASSGICTFRRGRLPPVAPPRPEFVRLGGPKVDDSGPVEMAEEAVVEEIEILRFGFGGLFI